MKPVALEEHSNSHVTGQKPRHKETHTFCRKTSENAIDKERIMVGIVWILGTAGRVSLKTSKLLFFFPYKHLRLSYNYGMLLFDKE